MNAWHSFDPIVAARRSASAKLAWDSGKHPHAGPAADRRQSIAGMLASGMTQRAIAASLGITHQRVSQLLKRHRAWIARFSDMGEG